MIKITTTEDKEPLLAILERSGQFDEDGLQFTAHTMDEFFAEPDQSIWLTAHDTSPVGVAYCAPEPMANGTWNLYMLWLDKQSVGKGLGKSLIKDVEDKSRSKGARLLIVETSSLDEFATARSFYQHCGYTLASTIEDFYDVSEAKLTYVKYL